MQENTKNRMKLAGSLVVGGASVAALMFSLHHPKVEPIALQCPPTVQPSSPPVKGDLLCEVSKGEADPISPTFDPESCGYCGDGVRQRMSDHGSIPSRDPDTGERIQDVTERPTETPETCAVDFHCGNGRQDRNERYAGWAAPIADGGAYTFNFIVINESDQDCTRDYHPTRRILQSDGGEQDDPLPSFQTGQVWSCPAQVASTSSTDIVASQSQMTQSIIRRVAGIQDHSSQLRSILGVSGDARVVVSVSILVDAAGHLTIRNVSANCSGVPCGDQPTLINASQLTLRGLYMPPPGTQCLWTHNVTLLPDGGSSLPTINPKPAPSDGHK